MSITKDFEGPADTELTVYDNKFFTAGGTSNNLATLNGDGSCSGINTSNQIRYGYNDGQTGLDQSSKIVGVPHPSSGAGAGGPLLHIDNGKEGLLLYITRTGDDIGGCSVRTSTATGGSGFLQNVGNPSIPGGALRDIEYEIIAKDNGDNTVNVDVRIDGTPYPDVVTNHAITPGYPGFQVRQNTGVWQSMTVSNGAAVVAPTWGTVTLPTVTVGQGWSTDLNTFITDTGGEAPTFSVASGNLPTGITLNANGTFSGTASADGSDTVTFTATNSGGSADSNAASWTVNPIAPSGVIHTVRFSDLVTYTGINPSIQAGQVEGVKFVKNGVDSLEVRHWTNMGSPNTVIEYDVDWTTPVQAGDTINFVYDGISGEYQDDQARELGNQNFVVENCEGGAPPPPGGGPASYTRFLTFEGANDGDDAVAQLGAEDFDWRSIAGRATVRNSPTFAGYKSVELFGPQASENVGGRVGVRTPTSAANIPWPIGTEVWAQIHVWPTQSFIDAGGLLLGNPQGTKFWRFQSTANFNTLHPSTISGAPADTVAKMGMQGPTARLVIGWPTLPNNGQMIANQWNTYEIYYRVGDNVSLQGLTRCWKEHVPAKGYYVQYLDPTVFIPVTEGGGYEFNYPQVNAGGEMSGGYEHFGVWNYCGNPNPGPCENVTVYTAAHVVLVSQPGQNLKPDKICPVTGHPFIGDWEND